MNAGQSRIKLGIKIKISDGAGAAAHNSIACQDFDASSSQRSVAAVLPTFLRHPGPIG